MANSDSIRYSTECPIHMGRLERPKLLPCLHKFCEDCLKEWQDTSDGILSCPLCKSDYGQIDVSQLPNYHRPTRVVNAAAENSTIENVHYETSVVVVVIKLRDCNGEDTMHGRNEVTLMIIEPGGDLVEYQRKDGTSCEYVFHPKSNGNYIIHAYVQQSELGNSPKELTLLPPKDQPGFKFGQVKYYGAHDAAVHDNEIFITDKYNHRVVVINKGGQELRSFTIEEDNMSAFDPFGITISTTGTLYITDMKNHEVFICDLYGNVHQRIGKHVLKKPNGIALTTNNEILVVDYEDCCVHRFEMNGEVLSTVGGPGTGRFSHPWFIAINSKGEWIVSDCDNKCFHIIHRHDGRYTKINVGYKVRGVTVDSRDNIFISVAEIGWWTDKFAVLMYYPKGECYGYISRRDTLLRPRGMCTTEDSSGREILIVTDDSKALHKYDML
ncbi:tripartite motif-containing protein 3-like [Anneissia japonica]|uniref:tripartite motif-containing protein 3-like n=1 Tax=Anneissia japonica TaxID=1529436 RepID=UPI00142594F9|nr:tripartite motif-containing protein 3-like [Anneissia japonica]